MKRLLALLVTLTMVLQVGGAGLTFAEETATPKVTLVYTDEEGTEHTVELDAENPSYYEDGISAAERSPESGVWASSENEDTRLTVTVDGNVILVTENEWAAALEVGTNTDVTVTGKLVGRVQTTVPVVETVQKEEKQDDGRTLVTSTVENLPMDSTITVVGDIDASDFANAVVAQGDSEVTVNGNVDGEIVTNGNATVTVNGEVSGDSWATIRTETDSNSYTEVYYRDENGYREYLPSESLQEVDPSATITVNGDVTAENTAINVEGTSTVTVNGDVNAGSTYEYTTTEINPETQKNEEITKTSGNGAGIQAFDSATVTVNGDVTAEGAAIQIYNDSDRTVTRTDNGDGTTDVKDSLTVVPTEANVTVNGNVTSNYSSGVYAMGESTVTVEGDVSSNYIGIIANESANVKVTGNVSSSDGNGISTNLANPSYTNSWKEDSNGNVIPGSQEYPSQKRVDPSATVIVGGDVNAYGTGINVRGTSEVEVAGNVTAGHEETKYETKWDDEKGEKVVTDSYTVYSGDGIYATDAAKVTVGGNVTSEATGISTRNNSEYKSETVQNEDGSYTVTTNNTATPTTAEITVEGDVVNNNAASQYENHMGIRVGGESVISVGGNVTAEGGGIWASGEATVDVGGDVTAKNDAAIRTTPEDLTYTYTSTYKYDENGNYQERSNNYESGETSDAAQVTVSGDVIAEANTAIDMTGNSTVKVEGDVTGGYVYVESDEDNEENEEYVQTNQDKAWSNAWDEAFKDYEFDYSDSVVNIRLDDEANAGELVVGGTVKANEESDAIPLVVSYTVKEDEKLTEMPELPEMKVYEILPNGGEYFDVNVIVEKELTYSWEDEETGESRTETSTSSAGVALPEEDKAAMVEAIAAAIQYIIKLDAVNGTIDLGGKATYDAENGFYTAHENEEVSVTVRPDDGYELSGVTATGNYTLTQNADGSWTLTVQRGGGVTVSAILAQKSVPSTATPKQEEVTAPTKKWVEEPAISEDMQVGTSDVAHAMVALGETLKDDDDSISVEIVGLDKLLDKEEKAAIKNLPSREQVILALYAMGLGDLLEDADFFDKDSLSDEAKTLANNLTEKLAGLSADEQKALLAPFKAKVIYNGEKVDGYQIVVKIHHAKAPTENHRLSFYEVDGKLTLIGMEILK